MDAEARAMVRKQAYQAMNQQRETAIRILSRERGGINDRTRTAIFAEAEAKARHAARNVYLAAGYGECMFETSEQFEGSVPKTGTLLFVCPALTTPGYRYCPTHGQAKPVASMLAAEERAMDGPQLATA